MSAPHGQYDHTMNAASVKWVTVVSNSRTRGRCLGSVIPEPHDRQRPFRLRRTHLNQVSGDQAFAWRSSTSRTITNATSATMKKTSRTPARPSSALIIVRYTLEHPAFERQ